MASLYYGVYRDGMEKPVTMFSINRETKPFALMNARQTACVLSGINQVIYEVKLIEKVRGKIRIVKPH